jgi:hypothetical protein
MVAVHDGFEYIGRLIVSPIAHGQHKGKWRVEGGLIYGFYLGRELTYVEIRKGFYTDGATVPWWAKWVFPRVHARYMREAVLHDWCLKHERHRFSRNDIDKIFGGALVHAHNKPITSTAMYLGVTAFGRISERKKYGEIAWQTSMRLQSKG